MLMTIDGITNGYINNVLQTATKYAKIANRNSATSFDVVLALKFEAVKLQERPELTGQVAIWTEFSNFWDFTAYSESSTGKTDSDFTFVDLNQITLEEDKLFVSEMHDIHSTWHAWTPLDKTQRMLKDLVGNWSENFTFLF
jgi:hypothetical protein